MKDLMSALDLAAAAHAGQVDKAGQPYIDHPIRVAAHFSDETLGVIALLHDVVEDTPVTLERIAQEFGPDVAAEVEALTRREGESYAEFIRRVAQRPLARRVKIADLQDNLDLSRLPSLSERDWERVRRYREALAVLQSQDPIVPDRLGGKQ